MRSRSLVLFLLLSAILCGAQESRPGGSRILPLDSEVYTLMRRLSVERGMVFPSQTLPWSVDEARFYLDRIGTGRLSSAGRKSYERIEALLKPRSLYSEEEGRFVFAFSPRVSLEGYLHFGDREDPGLGPKDDVIFPGDEIWEHGYDDRLALIVLPLEVYLYDHLYAAMEIDIRQEPKSAVVSPDRLTNVFTDAYDIYIHAPFRAFLAYGGPHWTIQFGRDTLSWGSGVGGNLTLSDYGGYHDFLRLTTFWRGFKWTAAYIALEPWLTAAEKKADEDVELYKALFSHRFEFRIRDRVTLMLTESVIQGRKYPDISVVNPLMWFHNWYHDDYNNVTISVGTEATILPGLAVYAQSCLYQWQTPKEESTFPGASDEPDAFGYLLGLEGLYPLGRGYAEAGLEWIHTNPWLYTMRFGSQLLNYTSRKDITARSSYMLDRPLGYRYGPDADVKTLRLGYRVPGHWAAQLTAEYRLKGELSIADPYPDDQPYYPGVHDAELDPQYNDPDGARTPTGEHPERTWVVGVSGEISPLPFLTTGGGVAWIRTQNRGARAHSPENDAEITAFVTVTY